MKLFDAIKEKAKKFAIEKYLIDAGLSHGFVESLKKGYLLISEDRLRSQIEEAIASEEGIVLRHCEFSSDGISLELSVARFRARLTLPLKMRVSRIAINGQEQIIEVHFANGKAKGENWIGKLVSFVANGSIAKILNERMVQNNLAIESYADKKGGRCVLDLGGLEQVQLLKKKIPVLGLKMVDLLSIDIVEHVAGGIRLKAGFSLRNFLSPPS